MSWDDPTATRGAAVAREAERSCWFSNQPAMCAATTQRFRSWVAWQSAKMVAALLRLTLLCGLLLADDHHALAAAAARRLQGGALCLDPAWHWWHHSNATVASSMLQQARPVVLEANNWETHSLVTHVAKILLEEGLGESVALQHHGGGAVYERAAKAQIDANLEVWPNGKHAARQKWLCANAVSDHSDCSSSAPGPCAVEQFHTAVGRSAQSYVASANYSQLLQAAPDFWRSYTSRDSAAIAALPPVNFSVPGLERELCTRPICSPDGRWYPSQCGGVNGTGSVAAAIHLYGCRAYFSATPLWDEGVVEAAIEASGMLLVVVYLGPDPSSLSAHIEAASSAGHKLAVFYHWVSQYCLHNSQAAATPGVRRCNRGGRGDRSRHYSWRAVTT